MIRDETTCEAEKRDDENPFRGESDETKDEETFPHSGWKERTKRARVSSKGLYPYQKALLLKSRESTRTMQSQISLLSQSMQHSLKDQFTNGLKLTI